MKILFEEYAYSKDDVKAFVPEHCLHNLKNNKVSIPYVGYYYSSEIDDSVFILPKVFIKILDKKSCHKNDKIEKAFGKYDPKSIIDTDKEDNPIVGTVFFDHIFNLSTWIYRAIERYRERKEKEHITERVNVLSVDSANGEKSQTLINVVLDLVKFNKEHQGLFTFIAKRSNQGYHKINWQKTISKCQPFVQDDVPIYLKAISKSKTINSDEELIVLFFSVMDYLHGVYHFHIIRNLNYKTYPREVERMIASGKGTRYLRKIRHKYFKDELVKLWNLLYVFFRREEDMKSKKITEDYLLVSDFDRVFEDMIDSLISDDTKLVDKKMADQRDRKIVDHIYKYESLVRKDDIYYIGDSKYYKEGSDPGDESIYKQFTYARNVIQRNMDLLQPNESKIYRDSYFDSMTEGYNVTPNYFIRGTVEENDYDFSFRLDQTIKNGKADVERMAHHEDRLFDRDTLLVLKYNISFLFVLSSYASNHTDENLRRKIRNEFREQVKKQLDEDYKFYKLNVRPGRTKQQAVDNHFRLLIGKVFSAFGVNEDAPLLMALDKGQYEERIKDIFRKIRDDFEIVEYDLIHDKDGIVYADPKLVYIQSPIQTELPFAVSEDEVGEELLDIVDDVDDSEKYLTFLPVYSVKAACGKFLYNEEAIILGWLNTEKYNLPYGEEYFIVQAKGHSMEPRINDGDYCLFKYGTDFHENDVILVEIPNKDDDYGGSFTIKKYIRKKGIIDGIEQHISIVLEPLNNGYEPLSFDIETETDLKMVGVLNRVIYSRNRKVMT